MYIHNLPFPTTVPICCQMRLNVDFSGLSANKKKAPDASRTRGSKIF